MFTMEEKAVRAKVASIVRGLQVWGTCCGRDIRRRERHVDEAGERIRTRGAGFQTALSNLPFITLSMKTYVAGPKKGPEGLR